MLTAKQNNSVINLTKYSKTELLLLKDAKNYECPYCGAPVIFKQGPKRKAHFSHITPCTYEAYDHESEAHQSSKLVLSQWLMNQGVPVVHVEHRFKEIKRIADIYFEFENEKYVIEIQKSAIDQALFLKRNTDYLSLGIQVLWIFIGDIKIHSQTYVLNHVMTLNKGKRLIHFDLLREKITVFDQLVWLNQKEVDGCIQVMMLKEMTIDQLIFSQSIAAKKELGRWLKVKEEFRYKKWQPYQRFERRLSRLCSTFQINVSLLPAEVGWPVQGEAYDKPLFIWQAYVVLHLMSTYEIQDVFSFSDLRLALKNKYRLKESEQSVSALQQYLSILSAFGMIKQRFGYYEYIKSPQLVQQIDNALISDRELGLLWLKEKN